MRSLRYRGLGPKVFISYSFKDCDLANALADHLRRQGLQVTIEDDTSLIGSKLAEALTKRINQAECVIQLRTVTSNRSPWVAHEMALAMERQARDVGFRLLFVVTDKESLPEAVSEWPYIDASTSGLSVDVLEKVVASTLPCVRAIGATSDLPTKLSEGDLKRSFEQSVDDRRVILDADGFWMQLAYRCVEEASDSDERRSAWWDEKRRDIEWLFEQADVAATCLMRELAGHFYSRLISKKQAYAVCNAYFRFVLIDYFDQIPHSKPVLVAALGTALDDDLREILRLGPGRREWDKVVEWALWPVRMESAYAYDPLVEVELGCFSGAKQTARIYFPRRALGREWSAIAPGQAAPPGAIISDATDWALFGLPMVAQRAIGAYATDFDRKDATFEQIDKNTGWQLSDFDVLGHP